MTNPNRRSVAPVRKLLAAVLGVIAVFVMLFGAGMTSWAIVALGAALLVLAIGLAMVNVARRGARAWVAGTAHVRSVGEPPAGVAFGRCELQLVVAAPGLPAAAVTVRDPRVPVSKWPDPGATLPVMVAIDDMRRVRIQWDDVMTHAEAAVAEATEEYPESAHDLLIDEFLSESEAPPWVTRDRHSWTGTDPGADRSGVDRGMAVREAGAGPIVLEGTLVEPESPPRQRRRPSPYPRPQDTLSPLVTDPPPADDVITVDVEDPSSDTGPRPPADPHTARSAPTADRPAPTTRTAADDTVDDTSPAGAATTENDDDAATGSATAQDDTVPTRSASAVNSTTAEHATTDNAAARDRSAAAWPMNSAGTATSGSTTSGPRTAGSADTGHAPADGTPGRATTAASAPFLDATGATGDAAGRPAPDPTVRDPELDLDLEGDAPHPPGTATGPASGTATGPASGTAPSTASDTAPSTASSTPTGTASGSADGESAGSTRTGSGPAAPLFSPVITGIDEPPPPVTTGINGVDLADRPKPGAQAPAAEPSAAEPSAAEPSAAEPSAAEPPTAAAPAGPPPAEPDQNIAATPVTPAPVSPAPVSPAPRSRSPLDDAAPPVIPAPRNPAQDVPDRESQKHTNRLDDIITAYPSARPGPAGAIHGIGLTVLVGELDRSRRFYRDLLGFHEIDAGGGSAVLASGDTRLVLRTGAAVGTARPIHLNLEVGDLDAMHAELLGKGVEFSHGPRVVNRGERLELWAAELDDPDGHTIAISQWRAVD